MSYDNYTNWKNWNSESFGKWDETEDIFYRKEILRLLPSRHIKGASVFELGFGNGSFLGWGRNHGMILLGSEIIPELVERGRRYGVEIVSDISNLETESLDIAVAFDVFEHIPIDDLSFICRNLHRALKPSSHLVARFPNGDSPFSLPLQNGDATHVHSLGQNKIKELMFSSGFQNVELREPVEIPTSVVSKIALPAKKALRYFYLLYARLAFLGPSAPPTYAINYFMIASKR